MKQVTTKQLESLALADKAEVARWTEYSVSDWIVENARFIGMIETKKADKTLFG